MSVIPGKVFWLAGLAILGVVAGSCDGTGGDIEVESRALQPWLRVSGIPDGLTCGLSYLGKDRWYEDESCLGSRTVTYIPAPNFNFRAIGDRGLPAGHGFFGQASRGSGAATVAANSDRVALLPGTACGFKEICNNQGELCMGHDPWVSCPRGWVMHSVRDYGSTGCSFAWCAYADPNQVCCDAFTCDPACVANMPRGTTCGMGNLSDGSERCGLTDAPAACPAGFHRTKSFYDYGRPAGSGIFYCTKN